MSELRSNEEEWAKLAEAATPGPWWITSTTVCRIYGANARERREVFTPSVARVDREDDAAFIAAAREAVPSLLAEVTRLRTETGRRGQRMDEMAGLTADAEGDRDRAIRERDAARAEVSQLRAKIETALAEAERFMPYEKGKIRAALAEPLGSTPEQPAEGRSAEPMPTAATIAGIERIASQRTGPEFRVELEDEA